MGKDLNTHLAKKDIQMIKIIQKLYKKSYTIRDFQIKIVSHHSTPTRMAELQNYGNTDCWRVRSNPSS